MWRLAFAALLVAGCGRSEREATAPAGAPAPTAGPQTLTVLDWAGFEDPQMFSTFQEKYPNVTVSVAFGESDADIYAKMKAGADACLFHFYSGWQDFYPRDGLVRELDTARLSHWAEIPERFKALGRVDGKQYFIPWDWGFTSILYRTDKLPGGVESWSTLFDPALAGHLSMWDDGPGAVAVASYIKGWDETKLGPEQLAEIERMWVEQRKLNRFYWTGEPELVQGMASGEIWAAYAWACPWPTPTPPRGATAGLGSMASRPAARSSISPTPSSTRSWRRRSAAT
jgi:spermidine/putrescine transport system substrate-binding protein